MDKNGYEHLSPEERAVIMVERRRGSSCRAIATLLGRAPSTVSREVARTTAVDAVTRYDATAAAMAYRDRRRHCVRRRKLQDGTRLHRLVSDRLLHWRWSPQQIASRLRRMHPEDPSLQVSHETIYAAIYAHPRGALKQALVEALRQHKPQRGRRRRTAANTGGVVIPDALRIRFRPEDVAERTLPGHWEGDFMKGAYNRSAVGTLVERKTRFVVLCKMNGCGAEAALDSFTRQMKKLPAFLRESLTYDRGSEMAQHEELARRLKLTIWFADPYAPWQRGSNENTNGLLRQFLPKGTDLSQVSQTQLNDIARLLNGRPRQTLDWQTPEEVMAQEIRQFRQRDALDS
jgi:IS30 family transposase